MTSSSSSLSLCMTASGPAGRVQAILKVLRPVVDEIVLGVDLAGDPNLLELDDDIVDLLLPFESTGFGGGLIGWIQHQCSCAWILRLDDDEMPGTAVLEELSVVTADRSLTHALMPRRWLYPDVGSYLASHPWLPDYQLRLVRNMPGIWRFGGRVHDGPAVYGAHRLLQGPIYHADCLLQDVEQRRAKAMRYERSRPGHRNEGFPVNAMYLPEACEGLELRSVSKTDQTRVAQLLDQSLAPVGPRKPGPASPITRKDEILVFNSGRTVSPNAYQAVVTVPNPRPELPVGTQCGLDVVVRNLGDDYWPPTHVDEPPIRVGCRWLDAASLTEVAGEGRTGFPALVEPGQEARVRLGFETPANAGDYLLEVDVVHEEVRWFGCGVRMPVALVGPGDVSVLPMGSQFTASYGLDGIDLRLVELIGPAFNGTFIEAGANDGLIQSNTALLERSFGWRGLLVEPVPRLAEQCRINRPAAVVEQAALVPFEYGDQTVVMSDCGLMSLVGGALGDEMADAEHLRRGSALQGGLAVEKIVVPAVPLSQLIHRHGLGRVDLLVLDVEGYEASVLRGLDMAKHAPKYLLVEARFRKEVDTALGSRYLPVAQLSHHDVLYRRSG